MKVLVTTYPFNAPIYGCEVFYNTKKSKYTQEEVELTMTHIFYLLKKIHKQEMWKKTMGKEIRECKIGIVGFGRIGKEMLVYLSAFSPREIHLYDKYVLQDNNLEKLYKECDIITFHTPSLDKKIGRKELEMMKEDVILVNTARGTLFDEKDLYEVLSERPNMSLGMDVFETEPYVDGDLTKLDNVLLTPHIGSFTSKGRSEMEKEAVENIKQYIK